MPGVSRVRVQPAVRPDTLSGTPARWSDRYPPEISVLLALALGVFLVAPLNTDSGYCLVAGRRLLEGERLYVDMMETNPPLIFWLMAVVAWVGRFVPIADARLVGAFLSVVLFVSSLTGLHAMALPPRASRSLRFCVFAAFLCSLILPFVSWTGQREQIAAMLLLPYTLLAARAASRLPSPRGLSIWCGVLGGLGLAIKPFFLAAWVAIELAVFLGARRWPGSGRPEFWVAASIQIVYAMAVVSLTPEYLSDAVPLASALYGAYGRGVVTVVEQKHVWLIAAVGISACATDFRAAGGSRPRYAAAFGAATLGWLVAYVVPGKGWYYHLLPCIVFGTVAWVLAALNVSTGAGAFVAQRWRDRALTVALTIPLLAALLRSLPTLTTLPRDAMTRLQQNQPQAVIRMAEVVEQAAAGEPVYFFSTSMWPAFPVVNMAGVRWPYRYHFLWPIPALYPSGELKYRRPETQGAIERRFFDTVIDDLNRFPPRILVIDRRTDQQAMRGRTFDFVEYFSASPEFRDLFQRYRRLGYLGSWELYEMR